MWSVEYSIKANVEPEAIWRAFAEVERWPEWNADIEHIGLRGQFHAGSTITMTPRGGEAVELRIVEAVAGEQFVDEADVAGTAVRTRHRIELMAGHQVRITYGLEASGPAEEQVGPAVSADFPDTLAALVEHAGR